jgi:MFS transporter, FSR family, fosmidomycin resistance protein
MIKDGGLAPIAYGALADHSSRTIGVGAAALTAAVIVPLILALRSALEDKRQALRGQVQ